MEQIIIATKNKGKVKEFTDFFNQYNITALSLTDLEESIPSVEETGLTFKENAALKSEHVASILKMPALADDSGLVIDVLNGRPGVFSARYAGEEGCDEANMGKVLSEMKHIPVEQRTARFVCVISVTLTDEQTVFYTGSCEGTIAFSQIGTDGFGYDPIFIPKGMKQTMAQIPIQEKNKLSHRGQALTQLATGIIS